MHTAFLLLFVSRTMLYCCRATETRDPELFNIQIHKGLDPYVNRDPPYYNSKGNKKNLRKRSKPEDVIDSKYINVKHSQDSTVKTKTKIIHKKRRSSATGKHTSKSIQAQQHSPFQRIRGRGATLKRPITLNLQDSANPSNLRKSNYINKYPELSEKSANKKLILKSSQSTTNNPLVTKKTNFARSIVQKKNDFIQPKTRSTSNPLQRKIGDGKFVKLKRNLLKTKLRGSHRVLAKKIVRYVKNINQSFKEKPSVSNKTKHNGYIKTIYYFVKPNQTKPLTNPTIQPTRRKIQNRKMAVTKRQNGIPSRNILRNINSKEINFIKYYKTLPKLIQNMSLSKEEKMAVADYNMTSRKYKSYKNFMMGWHAGDCVNLGNLALEKAAMIVYEADLQSNAEQRVLLNDLIKLGSELNTSCTAALNSFKD